MLFNLVFHPWRNLCSNFFGGNLAITLNSSLCLIVLIQCVTKSCCFKPKILLKSAYSSLSPPQGLVQALVGPHLDYNKLFFSASAPNAMSGSVCGLNYSPDGDCYSSP